MILITSELKIGSGPFFACKSSSIGRKTNYQTFSLLRSPYNKENQARKPIMNIHIDGPYLQRNLRKFLNICVFTRIFKDLRIKSAFKYKIKLSSSDSVYVI